MSSRKEKESGLESGFVFRVSEMVSRDTFVHNGKFHPVNYNCMPVDLKAVRKLKQELLEIGYNKIFIIEMSVFGSNKFLVSADKTENNSIQIQSDLPEDMTLIDKILKEYVLFFLFISLILGVFLGIIILFLLGE